MEELLSLFSIFCFAACIYCMCSQDCSNAIKPINFESTTSEEENEKDLKRNKSFIVPPSFVQPPPPPPPSPPISASFTSPIPYKIQHTPVLEV